jgi:hemin uptake protein HemP
LWQWITPPAGPHNLAAWAAYTSWSLARNPWETTTSGAKVERVSADVVRLTLATDIRIVERSGRIAKSSDVDSQDAVPAAQPSIHRHQLFSAAQTVEILDVGRDKVFYLLRSGQPRSIKIGKMRRISGEWITEFVERRLDSQSLSE